MFKSTVAVLVCLLVSNSPWKSSWAQEPNKAPNRSEDPRQERLQQLLKDYDQAQATADRLNKSSQEASKKTRDLIQNSPLHKKANEEIEKQASLYRDLNDDWKRAQLHADRLRLEILQIQEARELQRNPMSKDKPLPSVCLLTKMNYHLGLDLIEVAEATARQECQTFERALESHKDAWAKRDKQEMKLLERKLPALKQACKKSHEDISAELKRVAQLERVWAPCQDVPTTQVSSRLERDKDTKPAVLSPCGWTTSTYVCGSEADLQRAGVKPAL